MTKQEKPTPQGFNQYDWAVNNVKLQQSIRAVSERARLDSTVKVDEDTVKAEYVKRAGLLKDDSPYEEFVPEESSSQKTTRKYVRRKK